MNKLLIFLLSLCVTSLEAATITNWGAQLPTAVPASGDVILMQKGGVTYYFTPNQLAVNISTNSNSLIASKQSGSFLLTNLLAMGVSNVLGASGIALATNNGTLYITNTGSASASNVVADLSGKGTNTTIIGGTNNVSLTLPHVAASRVAVFDGSKLLTNSSAVDLTELEYIDGVTSPLQTQVGAKISNITGKGTNASLYGTTLISGATTMSGSSGNVIFDAGGNLVYFTRPNNNYLYAGDPAGTLNIGAGGSQMATFSSGGKLGLSNSTPAYTLDVGGEIYASGALLGPVIAPIANSTTGLRVMRANKTEPMMTFDSTTPKTVFHNPVFNTNAITATTFSMFALDSAHGMMDVSQSGAFYGTTGTLAGVTATVVSNSTSITLSASHGLTNGAYVKFGSTWPWTYVLSGVGATTATLSRPAQTNLTGVAVAYSQVQDVIITVGYNNVLNVVAGEPQTYIALEADYMGPDGTRAIENYLQYSHAGYSLRPWFVQIDRDNYRVDNISFMVGINGLRMTADSGSVYHYFTSSNVLFCPTGIGTNVGQASLQVVGDGAKPYSFAAGVNDSPLQLTVHTNGLVTVRSNLFVMGTTNQVIFGATNIAPASAVAPTKWVSVQVTGDSGVYRIPLYQ